MKNCYKCNSCGYESTRKTNANRHIKLIHRGNARAVHLRTGKDSREITRNQHFNNKDLGLLEQELALSRIINAFQIPFAELERLASVLPFEEKSSYLSNVVHISLLSKNPIKCLYDQFEMNKSEFYLRNIANYTAAANKIPIALAVENIKHSLISRYNLHNNAIPQGSRIAYSKDSVNIDHLLSEAALTCFFNKDRARSMVQKVLEVEPANKIALTIQSNLIDRNPDSVRN